MMHGTMSLKKNGINMYEKRIVRQVGYLQELYILHFPVHSLCVKGC